MVGERKRENEKAIERKSDEDESSLSVVHSSEQR
jgi:hypothetical protein